MLVKLTGVYSLVKHNENQKIALLKQLDIDPEEKEASVSLRPEASRIRFLAYIFKQENEKKEFAVDSFPVTCCSKNRIDKRHLFTKKEYIGYSATKQRYFCGIKVHMIVLNMQNQFKTQHTLIALRDSAQLE